MFLKLSFTCIKVFIKLCVVRFIEMLRDSERPSDSFIFLTRRKRTNSYKLHGAACFFRSLW
jgi:hypothetical protein